MDTPCSRGAEACSRGAEACSSWCRCMLVKSMWEFLTSMSRWNVYLWAVYLWALRAEYQGWGASMNMNQGQTDLCSDKEVQSPMPQFPSCWSGIKSDESVAGYHQGKCVHCTSGMLCHAGWCFHSHSWMGLWAAILLWKLARCLLVGWKLFLREEAFRSEPDDSSRFCGQGK